MTTTDPTLGAPTTIDVVSSPDVVGRSPGELFRMRFRKDKAAIVGLFFIGFLILVAIAAPLVAKYIAHHGPNDLHPTCVNDFGLPKMGPSKEYWLGCDAVGRDVFVRTIYGARASLEVGLIATAIAMVIGITLGMVAGFFGGWIDTLISRVIDIMLSLPLLLFAIGIAAACGANQAGCFGGLIKPGLGLVIFIVSLFSWTYIARIIRSQTLSLREREFVEASRSMGASNFRILTRELLPNLVAPIVIYTTLLVPANVLFEAYLSFLGVGLPPNLASWGGIISGAQNYYFVAWWLMFFPGFMLLFTTLGFNLVGDGLRDALDPRTGRA